MSFRIYVDKPEDVQNKIPMPEIIPYGTTATEEQLAANYAAWKEYETKMWWYNEPLASDGTYYEFWAVPASQLGLALLRDVYQHGLEVATPEQIAELVRELDLLESYWDRYVPESKEYLQERMDNLREGLRIAKEKKARLHIM